MMDNSDEALRNLKAVIARRLEKAAIFLQNEIKESISTPSRTVGEGVISRGKNAGKTKKVLGKRGSNRSEPGQPPHKDFGNLRASITHDVDGDRLIARIGSPSKVARWMELGTNGGKIIEPVNKKVLANKAAGLIFGKRVVQGAIKPRPFLRPALTKHKQAIARIIAGESA